MFSCQEEVVKTMAGALSETISVPDMSPSIDLRQAYLNILLVYLGLRPAYLFNIREFMEDETKDKKAMIAFYKKKLGPWIQKLGLTVKKVPGFCTGCACSRSSPFMVLISKDPLENTILDNEEMGQVLGYVWRGDMDDTQTDKTGILEIIHQPSKVIIYSETVGQTGITYFQHYFDKLSKRVEYWNRVWFKKFGQENVFCVEAGTCFTAYGLANALLDRDTTFMVEHADFFLDDCQSMRDHLSHLTTERKEAFSKLEVLTKEFTSLDMSNLNEAFPLLHLVFEHDLNSLKSLREKIPPLITWH